MYFFANFFSSFNNNSRSVCLCLRIFIVFSRSTLWLLFFLRMKAFLPFFFIFLFFTHSMENAIITKYIVSFSLNSSTWVTKGGISCIENKKPMRWENLPLFSRYLLSFLILCVSCAARALIFRCALCEVLMKTEEQKDETKSWENSEQNMRIKAYTKKRRLNVGVDFSQVGALI